MGGHIVVYDKNNKKLDYDVLINFDFDGQHYIVYTDNKYSEDGQFNLYKAMLDVNNKLCDVIDVDVIPIIDRLILDYKNKVIMGEI